MLLYILTKLSILVKVLLKQNFFFVCSVLIYTFVPTKSNKNKQRYENKNRQIATFQNGMGNV